MKNDKGLCSTCVEVKGCILMNSVPVWFCEEFSSGNHSSRFKDAKVRRVIHEEITESE